MPDHVRNIVRRLDAGEAHIAVLGLGYVGLPVAAALAGAGYVVRGIDVRADRAAMIARGESPIQSGEPDLADLIAAVVAARRLQVAIDSAAIAGADVLIVVVDTPVHPDTHQPDYANLHAALAAAAPHLKAGMLVIVESTIAPGTMQSVVVPVLESGSGLSAAHDLLLVHCPERIMPGKLLANLRSCSRVIGGWTPDAARAAVALYRRIVHADLDVTDCLTAEIVKTAENAYRDVQIAFANELALICESVGADVWTVRDLVNHSPGRQVHLPGAGVGGHCIPKDPWLLIAGSRNGHAAHLIPTARAINEGMPMHMASLIRQGLHLHGRDLAQSTIAVLGYAYLENSDDDRNSPSAALVAHLTAAGAEVRIHDPYVAGYAGGPVLDLIAGADAVAIMVGHHQYNSLNLCTLKQRLRTPVLVDGRHVVDDVAAAEAGLTLLSLGNGRTPWES